MRRRLVHDIERAALVATALLATIFAAGWIAVDGGFAAALLMVAALPLVLLLPLAVVLFEQFDRSPRA
jgi:hypothetical protein